MEEIRHYIIRGGLGVGSSFALLAVSAMEKLHAVLSIVLLLVGIVSGLVSIWAVLEKRKYYRRKEQKEEMRVDQDAARRNKEP